MLGIEKILFFNYKIPSILGAPNVINDGDGWHSEHNFSRTHLREAELKYIHKSQCACHVGRV